MIVFGLKGKVRGVRELRKKSNNEVFAREVSVLTELGSIKGDTVRVTVFVGSHPEIHILREEDPVDWAVSVEKSEYGLNVVFREDAAVYSAAAVLYAEG